MMGANLYDTWSNWSHESVGQQGGGVERCFGSIQCNWAQFACERHAGTDLCFLSATSG